MTRPTSARRGYGARWQRRRDRYLAEHPTCVLCGARATVPDHHPVSRKQLVEQGVRDPDADEHLRPLCDRCHNRETARNQPGGFNTKPRRREQSPHPGLIR